MKPHAAADVAAPYTENDQRAFRVRQAIEAIEQACTPEGLRTYLSIKFPINDADGTTTTIGSISIDITKRVLDEQRMARLGHWHSVHAAHLLLRPHPRPAHRCLQTQGAHPHRLRGAAH